jgi:hypothetical protein
MNKIDWKRKLSSRKLWLALAGFVSMLTIAFGYAEETATQIAAIIMAGADVLGYIIAEGLTDHAAVGTKHDSEDV